MTKLALFLSLLFLLTPKPAIADLMSELNDSVARWAGNNAIFIVDFVIYEGGQARNQHLENNLRTLRLLEEKRYLTSIQIIPEMCQSGRALDQLLPGCRNPNIYFVPLTDNIDDIFAITTPADAYTEIPDAEWYFKFAWNNNDFRVFYIVGQKEESHILEYTVETSSRCDYKLLIRHIVSGKTEMGNALLGTADSFKQWMCLVRTSDGFRTSLVWNAY